MHVVVTGCAGFIGSSVVHRLLSDGHYVVGIDALLPELYPAWIKRENLVRSTQKPNFRFEHSDLRQMDIEECIEGADAVINLAAMPGLSMSWEELELYLSCNVMAVGRLLNAIRATRVPRLIHISTSSVYGSRAVGDESTQTRPISPYGATKLASEHLVEAYSESFGIDAVILRYFSVYGPRQRPDMAYYTFTEALLRGRELVIYGDGTQSRSNTYVDDCVDGTILALERFRPGSVFNIAGGTPVRLLDAIEVIADELGIVPNIRFGDRRPGDQLDTNGDIAAAVKALGYEPCTDPEVGLRNQVRWHVAIHEQRHSGQGTQV